jgi:hypothetical protein
MAKTHSYKPARDSTILGFGRGPIFVGALLLAVAACTDPVPEPAGAVALDERPSAVPDDYVITPFGWFHPSCVVTVSDPPPRDAVPRSCTMPSYRRARGSAALIMVPPGETLAGAADTLRSTAALAVEHEWNAQATEFRGTGTPYFSAYAEWTVPAAPATRSSQTVYWFTGMEPADNSRIIQPVLGWNANNDQAWTISSWDCCVSGVVQHSSFQAVAVGDRLYGDIVGLNCSASTPGSCSWFIIAANMTTGASSILTTGVLPVMRYLNGGVLETWATTSCKMLSGDVTFSNEVFGLVSPGAGGGPGIPITPAWGPLTVQNPKCNFAITAVNGSRVVSITSSH